MAEWLANEGHDVRVVTAPPYYPDWRVRTGYSAKWFAREERARMVVLRCPLWVPRRPTGLRRILHLCTFGASSFIGMLGQLSWRPEVVWVVEPSLFCAPGALIVAKLAGAPSWLHIQDFEIDAAFEMGLLSGGSARRWLIKAERWLLRRFDAVSTISGRMMALAEQKGVDRGRLHSFVNWADVSAIRPLLGPSSFRRELQIGAGMVVALYSGNMGAKQGLETLAEVARLLHDDERIIFVFCGEGAGREGLVKQCKGLRNVIFMPLQPKERLGELLGLADIHLMPQRSNAADLVLPSKLTGMFASGRAVIATAEPATELGTILSTWGCGVSVPPGDVGAFRDAVLALTVDTDRRTRMGAAGRAYAERELDGKQVLTAFSHQLAVVRARGRDHANA